MYVLYIHELIYESFSRWNKLYLYLIRYWFIVSVGNGSRETSQSLNDQQQEYWIFELFLIYYYYWWNCKLIFSAYRLYILIAN